MYKSTPSSKTCNVRMCMLPVSKLMVDHTYQRNALSQKNINEIVKDYAVGSFGTLNVADRNGVYYVVDGQHRLAAAKKLGLTAVPCAIWISSGVEQEAAEFERCNSARKVVDSYNRYRAMVVSQNPEYLECEKILHRNGVQIGQNPSPKFVAFPACAIDTMRMDPKLFETCLVIQRGMIGHEAQLGEQIHKGLFYALRRIESMPYNMDEIARKVYALGGKTALMHEIRKVHLECGTRDGSNAQFAQAILNVINKAIGRGRKVAFKVAA